MVEDTAFYHWLNDRKQDVNICLQCTQEEEEQQQEQWQKSDQYNIAELKIGVGLTVSTEKL